jgi:hypothetical protein
MAEALRYNSLGQILAAGGEFRVATLVAEGWGRSHIAVEIASRYPNLPKSDIPRLIDFAESSVKAGTLLNGYDGTLSLNLDDVPINPYLFADSPLGRRIMLAANYRSPETGKLVSIRGEFDGTETLNEIVDTLLLQLASFIVGSPDFAKRVGFNVGEASDFIFFMTERRY